MCQRHAPAVPSEKIEAANRISRLFFFHRAATLEQWGPKMVVELDR